MHYFFQVDEWPWVKFFKKKPGRQILWEMQETRHQVIKEDVAGLLRPPELARCGSRFLYVFEGTADYLPQYYRSAHFFMF